MARLGQVYRLRGPAKPTPTVSLSSTDKQGEGCKNRKTLDLVLTFKESPGAWIEGDLPTSGPCAVLARPLEEGGFEIRVSYEAPKNARRRLEFLPFLSTEKFIVDHWLSDGSEKIAKKPKPRVREEAPIQKEEENPIASVDATSLGGAFEDQASWEKILGSAATALDFNSPELDRFRDQAAERKVVALSELEPVERLPLKLPLLDLPPMETDLTFTETEVKFSDFVVPRVAGESEEAALKRRAVQDGMNLVRIFAAKKEWLKADRSIAILEKGSHAALMPTNDAKWWALKGRILIEIGTTTQNKDFLLRAIEVWRDGLRLSVKQGGDSQDYLEYMALESVRRLFETGRIYAAASVLSWARRYSWTASTEERFAFLRGEAMYRLGVFEEAKELFEEYVKARAEIPLTAFADRRLVPAAAFRLGDLEAHRGDFKAAVEQYSRAFIEGPKTKRIAFEGNWLPEDVRYFPYVLFNRAEAYVRLGRTDAALRDLRAFLFIAPTDENVGLVYYRIGDLLEDLNADPLKVAGAWRECIFKASQSFGGRLCSARQAANEMRSTDALRWPRLVAVVEDSIKSTIKESDEKKGFGGTRVSTSSLRAYLDLVLADGFLRAGQPYQALLRLEGSERLEVEPYLRIWLREYLITALAGYGQRLVKEGKHAEVVKDYERRRKTVFLKQTREEVLWNLAESYLDMHLPGEGLDVLDVAERVRARIARKIMRPYDHTDAEWAFLRAALQVEYLAVRPSDQEVEEVRRSLEKIDDTQPAAQRLWIRFLKLTRSASEEAKWWEKLEKTDAFTWADVETYSSVLKSLRRNADRRELLERRVGAWFSEKSKIAAAKAPLPALALELFETRADGADKERALPVADYLLDLPDGELGPIVTKPMMAFKKGRVLWDLRRFADARQSFERAKQLAPDSVWGKLSASAQKEMAAGSAR